MTTKIIAPALAAVMLAASSGFGAAYANPSGEAGRNDFAHYQQCQAMAQQFNQYAATHKDAKNVTMAKTLRNDGLAACSNNDFMRGKMLLQQALNDVGLGQTSTDVS